MLRDGFIKRRIRYDYQMNTSTSLFVRKIGITIAVALMSLTGPLAFAQAANKYSLQGYLVLILSFLNNVIIPLIFSIALLFFLVNVARSFIIEAEADREKARSLALYGIAAFVFLVSIWGIVNMFVGGLGFGNNEVQCPDYLDGWCTVHQNNSAPNERYWPDPTGDPGCLIIDGQELCG